jgi:hypothetical protein
LLGISSNAGKAWWYFSTAGRIWSAICRSGSSVWGAAAVAREGLVTHVLVDEEDGNVAPLGVFGEGGFDSRDGRF